MIFQVLENLVSLPADEMSNVLKPSSVIKGKLVVKKFFAFKQLDLIDATFLWPLVLCVNLVIDQKMSNQTICLSN